MIARDAIAAELTRDVSRVFVVKSSNPENYPGDYIESVLVTGDGSPAFGRLQPVSNWQPGEFA